MNTRAPAPNPYQVSLIDAVTLNADERAAAELRFRLSIEFSLGGPDNVLPALQACMLVRALHDDQLEFLPEAEQQVVALWENAEADAIVAAFRPLDIDMDEARFEISALFRRA